MKRTLEPAIIKDFPEKMVLLMGPRQVGKTTLAKNLIAQFPHSVYLNYDVLAQRKIIEAQSWLPNSGGIVLDELHQLPDWKRFLKGVFDAKPPTQAILVTGSARLDTFRQTGESLAGRYFSYHLHPLSVAELAATFADPQQALAALMRFGGFPEPFLAASDSHRARWQHQYFTDLIREDILEFGRIQEVRSMRLLIALLRTRTGSPISHQSLARDLAVAPGTVRKYLDILQALHIVFTVPPYHRNIARALSKAPKLYFYDWCYVEEPQGHPPDAQGARLENLVAAHLLKHCDYRRDTAGEDLQLHYIQTTTGKEVDFVLCNAQGELLQAIEVKSRHAAPSYALKELARQHPTIEAWQLVQHLSTPFVQDGVHIVHAARYLAGLAG